MDWSEEHHQVPPPQSVENQQLADDLNVFYCPFEKTRLTPSTRCDLHFTHSPTSPLPSPPPPPPPPILHAFKVCVEDVNQVFRKQKSRKASGQDASFIPACLKVCADHLDPIFTHDLLPCASNAFLPPSFPSPKSPKSLAITDYRACGFSRLWSLKSFWEDWGWPIWRTSLGPWWILFSLPTEQTGLWMNAVNMGLHYILQLPSTKLRNTQGSYCGLQLGLQYHHARPSPRQTDTVICAHLHLSVDHQLPNRQAAASEAGQTHIQNSHHQHWRPSGLCSLPTALLPLHQWLHI